MRLKAEFAQTGVVVWAPPKRPMKQSIRLLDGEVVDAGVAMNHQTVVVELPVLISVRSIPVVRIVVRLVGEAHRNPVTGE